MGSVSTDTLNNRELLCAFLWECNRLSLTRAERYSVRKINARYMKCLHGRFGEEDAYFSDETCEWDIEELTGILESHALPYFYFGAHPGDGADFGFWLSEGFAEEFDGLKVNDTSEVPHGFTGEVLHVNDHGNMTLYAYSRGRGRELWGVV